MIGCEWDIGSIAFLKPKGHKVEDDLDVEDYGKDAEIVGKVRKAKNVFDKPAVE